MSDDYLRTLGALDDTEVRRLGMRRDYVRRECVACGLDDDTTAAVEDHVFGDYDVADMDEGAFVDLVDETINAHANP